MTSDAVLSKFPGVRKQGKQWLAKCPAHDDHKASLSIGEGTDGRILVKCQAGCATDSVCAAVGLTTADLFAEPKPKTGNAQRKIVSTYDYRDEAGALLFQTIRFEPKDFSQRQPDGNGGWRWNLQGVRRVLYRLPELLAADLGETVFLVEGEKDVDRLRAPGLVTTCNAMGAGKWRDEYNEPLRGRAVVIIEDNDKPGCDHAAQVARSLNGVAASVKVLRLSGLPDKGDVSNWLDAGGTVEQLLELVAQCPEWAPTEDATSSKTDYLQLLPVVRMADVHAKKVDWLWPNRIALHSITILEGIEGVGKSTLLCAVSTGVTRGYGLPQAERSAPANVLWLSAEDDLSRVLKPRLLAAGVDCERVFAVGEPFTFDERGLLGLRAAIAEHNPKLVIVDPIFAFTRGDANKGNDARALTGELKKIAEQFELAICLVRHVGKSKGLGDPRAAGLYSIEWRAAARSVLLMGADPDQPQKRAITQTKNNLGPLAESLGYTIEPDADSPSSAVFAWTGISDLTAERILAPLNRENDEDATERRDGVDFLRELLAKGEIEAKEIEKARKAAGISDYSLRKAKTSLRIKTRKRGGKFGGDPRWVWALPQPEGEPEGVEDDAEDVDKSASQRLQASSSGKSSYGNGLAEGVESVIPQRLQSNHSTPSASSRIEQEVLTI